MAPHLHHHKQNNAQSPAVVLVRSEPLLFELAMMNPPSFAPSQRGGQGRVAFRSAWANHNGPNTLRRERMSVVKFIELSARSPHSFEEAVRQAVERASSTIRN